jgi:glycosyltransferase involved in cell wall biosynthesis
VTGSPDPHIPDARSYYAKIKALQPTLGLEEEVVLIHEGTSRYRCPFALDPPVVAELHRMCDLVLMPSHGEGFGTPVTEAGLIGGPVFTARVPVVDDLGEKIEYLIWANESPEAVAARIWTWAEQDIGHRLRRRFRKTYAWSSIFTRRIEPLIMTAARSPAGSAA